MFSKWKVKLNTGVAASTALICILIFLALVPYSLSVIHRDFEEKATTLAGQYSKCLDIKFTNISNSAHVIAKEYDAMFTDTTLPKRSVNNALGEIRKGSLYLEGIAVVTQDSVFSSDVYYGGTALYYNFGENVFETLQESQKPRFLINKNVSVYRPSNRMIYAMPVTSGENPADYYILIFFDPLELIRNFKFEQNRFLDKSSVVLVTEENAVFQMRKRVDEPLVNTERRLSAIPEKRLNEYTVTYHAESGAFSILFYINKNAPVWQSVLIILLSLFLLSLASVFVILCTRRYWCLCEHQLNQLISLMDNYAAQHTEESYD